MNLVLSNAKPGAVYNIWMYVMHTYPFNGQIVFWSSHPIDPRVTEVTRRSIWWWHI